MQIQRRLPNGVGKIMAVVVILVIIACIHVLYQSPAHVNAITKLAAKGASIFTSKGNVPIEDANATIDFDRQKQHFKSKQEERLKSLQTAAKTNQLASLQMYIVPQVACPTMVRVGKLGDGGKYVCNPWRVSEDCVIYSLGVSGEVSFETDLYETTGRRCRFYCVDPGGQAADLFKPFNGTFIQAYMTGKADPAAQRTSIAALMQKYNHKKVDIIKMDIESWEFDSFKGFFDETKITNEHTPACQLFIEFHHVDANLEKWTTLFSALETRGFRMFSKEANMYCPQCHEYSYIHLSCLEQYGLAKDATFATFFV